MSSQLIELGLLRELHHLSREQAGLVQLHKRTHHVPQPVGVCHCARASDPRTEFVSALALQYDTDVTTWSPQGRLFQVEYAMEAVKQGNCAVGLRVGALAGWFQPCLLVLSDTHAVLATVKRSESELSSYQRKVFKIDDHMGIAIAGLTADGRG
eukprot:scaffold90906_cov22-Tisochrysis_lutea.AAC.2